MRINMSRIEMNKKKRKKNALLVRWMRVTVNEIVELCIRNIYSPKWFWVRFLFSFEQLKQVIC